MLANNKLAVTAGVLIGLAATSSRADLASGLRNYWDFDQNTEDSASDYAGSASTVEDDGTFAGANGTDGIGYGPGYLGGAGIELNGASGDNQNDGHVLVPSSGDTLYETGGTVTTSLWVRTAGNDTNWQAILSHGEGDQYRFARRGPSNPPIAAYAGGAPDIPGDNTTGPAIGVDNGWHHVLGITEAGVSTRLWVNGGLVATSDSAPAIKDLGNSADTIPDLNIGANPQSGDQNREWWGEIDDVAQWDRVLTDAEIGRIYNGGVAGKSLGQLIPEPVSASLMLLGLLGFGVYRRR